MSAEPAEKAGAVQSEVPWKASNWLSRGSMDALKKSARLSAEEAAGGILALAERPERKK
jgi:hypothetical protein